MSEAIYTAIESPRIDEDGVLRFHEGDLFVMPMSINLTDGDDPVTIQPEDEIEVIFYTGNLKRRLASRKFDNIEDNTVYLEFDDELSGCFRPKSVIDCDYTFEVRYNGKLIADNGRIEVIG